MFLQQSQGGSNLEKSLASVVALVIASKERGAHIQGCFYIINGNIKRNGMPIVSIYSPNTYSPVFFYSLLSELPILFEEPILTLY